MSTAVLRPSPAGQASSRFFTFCAQVLQPTKRHQSSYRRTRARLNVKPDASFLPSKTEAHDHIIFNPPPSMPNVYHTPTIFLPKTDKRRQLQQPSLSPSRTSTSTSLVAPAGATNELPPALTPSNEIKYHVTEEGVLEMQSLRRQDPWQWTVVKLAKKFDCSSVFVRQVIRGLSPEKTAQQNLIQDVIKSRWGPKRRAAREDRELRRARLLRDQ